MTSNTELTSWDDLDCDINLLRGIYAYGFENPSTIQKKAIIPFLNGRDIIAQAQSGTGKTGAFTIGTLGQINIKENSTQAIILSPTRELSKQIYTVLKELSHMMTGIRISLLVGGTVIDEDIVGLKNSPHVVVGCPGRVNDMIRRRKLQTKTVKVTVLDEADEMLSKGFKDQIYSIFHCLDEKTVQIALFSATLSNDLLVLSQKLLRNPEKILVKAEALTLEGIIQRYVLLENENEKYEALKRLYSNFSSSQCIIYCNNVRGVVELTRAMNEDGFPVCCLHSDQTQQERTHFYNDFKAGSYRVLISTNITARGIDIQQVSTVINYDIPKDEHTYLHRIGRSGRWGRKGVGVNFITQREVKRLRYIEQYYKTEISELSEDDIKLI